MTERKVYRPEEKMKIVMEGLSGTISVSDLYRNNTEKGGAPNIPIVIMVKVLFIQSIFTKMKPLRGKYMNASHS
jgi:hypothetical protein